MAEDFELIQRLSRDLALASLTLSQDEARFLVNAYYTIQDDRMRSDAQVRELSKSGEPHTLLSWFAQQNRTLEAQIKNALNRFALNHPVGAWMQGIVGIGPVISAGMLAYIDIEEAPTVGHIWRYAGMDPSLKWGKGEKRRYNADFKVLCYKAGESFVKFHNHEDCWYGHVYRKKKDEEGLKNIQKAYADQAASILQTKKISPTTEAYKYYSVGMLPPAHLHSRARRYAVKMFLSHLHHELYLHHYGEPPPLPYPITILGHADQHYIPPLKPSQRK